MRGTAIPDNTYTESANNEVLVLSVIKGASTNAVEAPYFHIILFLFAEKAFFAAGFRCAEARRQLRKQILLLRGQILRYLHLNAHKLVALAALVRPRNTLAAELQNIARLSAGFDIHLHLTV